MRVRQLEIQARKLVGEGFAGAYLSAFRGPGIEFEEVREYAPGDDVRRIDWNVTARMDRPFIKTFRAERHVSVMLVIDCSASTLFGTKRDRILEVCSLIAYSAMKTQDKVGLLLFSDRVELFVPPQAGRRHYLRLLHELITFSPRGSGTDPHQALEFLRRVHKRKGLLFLISDFVSGSLDGLEGLGKRFDVVAISITDPREFEFPAVGLLPIRDLESGITQLIDTSRKKVLKKIYERSMSRQEMVGKMMRRLGGRFVQLCSDQDDLTTLCEALRN